MNELLKAFSPPEGSVPFYISLAGVTYPDDTYHITRINSEVFVIEYIIDGDGYVCHEGETYHVGKDMIYFLPQGKKHDYYSDSDNPFTKIFLNVSGKLCQRLVMAYGLGERCFFDGNGLKALFEKIPDLICSDMSENEMQAALQGLFTEILARLSHAQAESVHSDEAVRLKGFLDSNLGRLVSAKELSRVIFRSPDYCLKLFSREFGITPYAYQLDRKMQIARALLADTHISIGEIAVSLGYGDLHYFSNLFKQKCGCCPSEYRKKMR